MARMPQSALGVGQSGNSPWGCRKAALAFLVVLSRDAPGYPRGQEALSLLYEVQSLAAQGHQMWPAGMQDCLSLCPIYAWGPLSFILEDSLGVGWQEEGRWDGM